jgi:hypothetical protein
MKFISPALHGVLDYLTFGAFLAIPTAYDFTGAYAVVCYLLAASVLVMALLTNMPLGAAKVLPFWVHGRVELVAGLVLIASPWIFGFAHSSETARNLFIGAGIAFLVVNALTDWSYRPSTATPTVLH